MASPFASMLQGFARGYAGRRAREERAAEQERDERIASALDAMPYHDPDVNLGYGLPKADTSREVVGRGPAPSFGGTDKAEIARGILETANELQMDPLTLGTMISYETAGTFDPTKRGPTTQHGQHRGFIQWGEPQAREYGVDWSNPVRSQLGRDGAIVRYYRKNGWRPGMSELDAYSIINAGAPGRYGASDANNGGAPGTVRDKVKNQMGGHRAKAEALLREFMKAPEPVGIAPQDDDRWKWFRGSA